MIRRRPGMLPAVLAFAVVMAAAGAAAEAIPSALEAQVTADFRAAESDLAAGRDLLPAAAASFDQAGLDRAEARLLSARDHFAAAGQRITGNGLLHAVSDARVPYLQPRLRAVRDLARMGIAISDAGLAGAHLDGVLLSAAAGPGGVVRVLEAAAADLRAVQAAFTTAQQAVAGVDSALLPGSAATVVENARGEIAAGLSGAGRFASLLAAISELLGLNGRRTYLVEDLARGGDSAGGTTVIEVEQAGLALAGASAAHPDGVIAIDPAAVAGPLKLAGSDLASVVAALAVLPARQWQPLLTALNGAATEGRFQFTVSSPAAEAMLRQFGWSGERQGMAQLPQLGL